MEKFILLLYIILLMFLENINGHRVKRIVGGAPAEVPIYDDPIVYTRFAGRSARIQGVRDFPHFVFRGIRYAYPPTGRDRFQVIERKVCKILESNFNFTCRDLDSFF